MAQQNDRDKQNALRRCQCQKQKVYHDNKPCGIARCRQKQNEINDQQQGNPPCNATPQQFQSDIHSQSGSRGVKELLAEGLNNRNLKRPKDQNTCKQKCDQYQDYEQVAYTTRGQHQNEQQQPRKSKCSCQTKSESRERKESAERNNTYKERYQDQETNALHEQLADVTFVTSKCVCNSKSRSQKKKEAKAQPVYYQEERQQETKHERERERERQQYQADEPMQGTTKCVCKSKTKEAKLSHEQQQAKPQRICYQNGPQRDTTYDWERERQHYQVEEPMQGTTKCVCKSKTKEAKLSHEQQQAKPQRICYQNGPQRDTTYDWERERQQYQGTTKCVCKSKTKESKDSYGQQQSKPQRKCYQQEEHGQQYERAKQPCPCKRKKGPEFKGPVYGRPCGQQFEIAKQNASQRSCKCRKPNPGYRLSDFWDYDRSENPCKKKKDEQPNEEDSSKTQREPREPAKKKERPEKATPKKKGKISSDDDDDNEEEEELSDGKSSQDTMHGKDQTGSPSAAESQEKIEGKPSMDKGPVRPRESPSKSDSKSGQQDKPSGSGKPSGGGKKIAGARPSGDDKAPDDGKPSGGGKKRRSHSSKSTAQEEPEPKKVRKKAEPKPPDCTAKKKKGCQKKCPPPTQSKKRMCKSKTKTKNEDADKKSPRQRRTCCDDRPPLHLPKPCQCKMPPPPKKKRKTLRRIVVTHNWEIAQVQRQLMFERAAKKDPYTFCMREQYRHCMTRCGQ